MDVAVNDEEKQILQYFLQWRQSPGVACSHAGCVVPTRRALNIEPTDALRTE